MSVTFVFGFCGVSLLAQPFETVSQFGAFGSFIREAGNEHRERPGVSRVPERAGIDRVETDITDQSRGDIFAGVPARALPPMSRASRLSFSLLCA